MNPRALLKATASAFRDVGIPDPEVDAALLLSHVTGQQPLSLRLDITTALPDDVLTRFDALVSRRLTRQPLQYLLHTQPWHAALTRCASFELVLIARQNCRCGALR